MAVDQFPNNQAPVTVSATAPSSPRPGDIWVDSGTESLSVNLLASKIAGPNLLHNGAFQVHQRGTSAASKTTGGYYTADRWGSYIATLGTWTNSVESDAPTGSGFRKSWKWLCTTADASPAAGDAMIVSQTIEGQNLQSVKKGTSSAQQLTISFWVKSNKTGTYIVELEDVSNTRTVSATYTISSSATWEQKVITFPADLTGSLSNDANGALNVSFWLSAGSTYTGGASLQTTWAATTANKRAYGQTNLADANSNFWQITGVQLEVGSVATGFQHKGYETELAECQRYYYCASSYNYSSESSGWAPYGAGYASSYAPDGTDLGAGFGWVMVPFPVAMRIAPTTIKYGGSWSLAIGGQPPESLGVSPLALSAASTRSALIKVTSGLLGYGEASPVMLLNNPSLGSDLAFSADL